MNTAEARAEKTKPTPPAPQGIGAFNCWRNLSQCARLISFLVFTALLILAFINPLLSLMILTVSDFVPTPRRAQKRLPISSAAALEREGEQKVSRLKLNDKVIITGAAGLVGQNLIALLEENRFTNIIAIDKNPNNLNFLRRLHPAVQTVLADLAEPGSWQNFFQDGQLVILLHAQITRKDA